MPGRVAIVSLERIENAILIIRGQKVLLDRDLAALYGVETRALNQAVRRNLSRFPADFMFKLKREEIRNLSQIVISSGIKHAPNVFVFTEQGVAMLSSVLKSPRAVSVNIQIVRAFVRIRQMLAANTDLAKRLNELERKYDSHFKAVFEAIRQLMEKPDESNQPREIGFHTLHDGRGAGRPLRKPRSPIRY